MPLARSLALVAVVSSAIAATGCDEAAKVLDANNAQPGEADGRAVELAASPSRFNAIALDDANVVMVQQSGDVFQRPKTSAPGALAQIGSFKLGAESSFDEGLAVDVDFIYLVDDRLGLFRIPRAGGDTEKLDDASGQSLALTTDAVFYASRDHKTVRRLDKKTKAATDYLTGQAYVTAVALDGDKVWISDRDAETISSVPVAGEAPAATVIAKDQAKPNTVGIGPDHVYWANGSLSDHKDVADKIFRVKKDGTGQPELVASTNATIVDGPIHADGQFLYYGQSASGIMRVAIGGGEAVKFLNICENGFALSTDAVFVVENNSNRWSEEDKKKPNRVMTATK